MMSAASTYIASSSVVVSALPFIVLVCVVYVLVCPMIKRSQSGAGPNEQCIVHVCEC